jgi:hypothetical protein
MVQGDSTAQGCEDIAEEDFPGTANCICSYRCLAGDSFAIWKESSAAAF